MCIPPSNGFYLHPAEWVHPDEELEFIFFRIPPLSSGNLNSFSVTGRLGVFLGSIILYRVHVVVVVLQSPFYCVRNFVFEKST